MKDGLKEILRSYKNGEIGEAEAERLIDSMSIIDFQMNLRKLIGDKANDAVPVLDMSVSDFADVLESL